MYIKPSQTYFVGTEQRCSRELFLLLIQKAGSDDVKAIVRKIALRQFGPWMMGKVAIYGERYTVSGAYGSDGLPKTVSDKVFDRARVALPADLYEAWSQGGGWNSCGTEAIAMREWAIDNLDKLNK